MNIKGFLEVLPYAVEGWLGIFIVAAVIMLCIWGLNKVTSTKEK
ncbi:MAG: hypothetical protein Q4C60_09070 [Eubacteriales bacterium]|nr:hypothetical protein [Eubacteriales bacterium]